ncbi:MAG: fumarylacetoacetate hydrolase family protein [Roseicyclus sp.]|uniref:fumarylacetoacetate hydrolase family protein n=1 Tax=Boseongicola sp. H5 TaxID=2763261 RepID=UPI001B224DF5|nr:fumarylacetoacetate hydrolase family protein [Boseongicola sp. H5]MBO6604691.1 fumarylacetoacetate hydrolase family protein [Roseicyclus sp.]
MARLVRYGPVGAEKPGLIDRNGGIRALDGIVGDIDANALGPASLARISDLDPTALPLVEGTPRIGPCVARPGKMVAIGLNYSDHAEEANMPIPTEPITFLKATSAISGPYDDVLLPPEATKTDWEVELAFVIGTTARRVGEADAMAHVAGYCIVNDVSDRGWQLERQGQWTKGKSHDTFAPTGPWLVTADEIGDPGALGMRLWVDGKLRQDGSTATMIFNVPHLVSYLSHVMTLEAGDIVTTGTPPGVGMGLKPPVYLEPGQAMRLEIDGLGHQESRVVALAP